MNLVAILGRQFGIGLAELESILGANNLNPLSAQTGAVEISTDIKDFRLRNLGSVVKFAEVVSEIPTNNWKDIQDHIYKSISQKIIQLPPGKLSIGISVYGYNVSPAKVNATSITLKKLLKSSSRPIRTVPNKTIELNSAQVLHNKLASDRGYELIVIKKGSKTLLARTIYVQDIDSYSARDQKRPARDARVGMLPPKLAQIIINLATKGSANPTTTILDPFCGTGVVLQEAMLMGFNVIGADLEPRMVDYSKKNIEWLNKRFSVLGKLLDIADADATVHNYDNQFDVVACETYLGRALSVKPDQPTLNKIMNDCDKIHNLFLKNINRQTKKGFRMCIAIPAWKNNNGFYHLKTLDHLKELGYNRIRFEFVKDDDLVYYRSGQQVGRELVILERI